MIFVSSERANVTVGLELNIATINTVRVGQT